MAQDIVTIHTHNCSREEYKELVDYLEEQCWDYKVNKDEGVRRV